MRGQGEAYNAHQLVGRAADFIPDGAVKLAKEGLQQWWWDTRLPKFARHFEKALNDNGGLCLVGERCSYRQPTATTQHAGTHSLQLALRLTLSLRCAVFRVCLVEQRT